jgi:hypothetical protein
MRIYTQITVEDHNFFPVVAWISKQGTEKEREKKKKKVITAMLGVWRWHTLPLEKESNETILSSQKKKKKKPLSSHGGGCTCPLNFSGFAGSTEFLVAFIFL